RYFPDPDLLPLVITDEYIESIKKHLPLKSEERVAVYREHLAEQEVEFLLSNLEIADYFDKVAVVIGYKPAYKWITVA
ncbi:Asp-tRNA(Asn)/Glu-tRNA(Gln) amidotransferase GatCAB subunit B, partial [Francisella tularensis subsp. holarctica]|nr:Asp-tRNA(Asn)/Glu-tRNA(Gln) amidotransferase GatCAB subunit B [Francisella tularensis subsp. holarctica]